jgi:hypothetical protein
MHGERLARWWITQESRALLTRLDRVRPFVLNMPMPPAAAVGLEALAAIEQHLRRGRWRLRRMVREFLRWIGSAGQQAPPAKCQRAFALLKLRFNAILAQLDIFADVFAQRGEHETGAWVAGLDDAAADALELAGNYYTAPPVVCYVTRGHGAAIRRARTRLPGGDASPVAIISIPRERMVGSGIAASLVHEVGHQGVSLLNLIPSLLPVLDGVNGRVPAEHRAAWPLWGRWLSEILADTWSAAKLGVGATLGLIGVVSLPRAFVFRFDTADPHPIPWVRVRLSCALGAALYPHEQWGRLAEVWQRYYPREGLAPAPKQLLESLEATMPLFVSTLLQHRPPRLGGQTLSAALGHPERAPPRLLADYRAAQADPQRWRHMPPTHAFAVLGQARAKGLLAPEQESHLTGRLLTFWAVQSAINVSTQCGTPALRRRRRAPQPV